MKHLTPCRPAVTYINNNDVCVCAISNHSPKLGCHWGAGPADVHQWVHQTVHDIPGSRDVAMLGTLQHSFDDLCHGVLLNVYAVLDCSSSAQLRGRPHCGLSQGRQAREGRSVLNGAGGGSGIRGFLLHRVGHCFPEATVPKCFASHSCRLPGHGR